MANVVRSLYKVYVGNIPWTVGHSELKSYFNKFGPVSLANVVFDKDTGLSRNYGFVFYRNKEAYEKVLNSERHKLEGNFLKVFPAQSKQQSVIMATSLDSFNDLKELGIDCEDNDSLTEMFNKAANHLPNLLSNLDNQTLLTLYGYYKQGSQGPCHTAKPSWYDMKAKSKWEAWNKLGDMSQTEAKKIYVETIKKLDPGFNSSKECWVSVSTLQNDQCLSNTEDRSIVDYVKEENCIEVTNILKSSNGKEPIDKLDEDGLGLIHWAADRGYVDILKILINFRANVNLQDSDGQTALHYASSCGHADCIKLLLENGARRDLVDNDGSTAEAVACDETVKELLINFV